MNRNGDHYFHAETVEKLSTKEFNEENRHMGKLTFNNFWFYTWKIPFIITLLINKRKLCLGLGLRLSCRKDSVHPDEETSFSYRLPSWWRVQRLQSFAKIVLGSKGQPKPGLWQSSVAVGSWIRVQVKNGRKGGERSIPSFADHFVDNKNKCFNINNVMWVCAKSKSSFRQPWTPEICSIHGYVKWYGCNFSCSLPLWFLSWEKHFLNSLNQYT